MLTFIATIIDEYLPLIYLVALMFHTRLLSQQDRLLKVTVAVLLALLLTYILKYAFQVPRPCILDEAYIKTECPAVPDFTFPSGHATLAAVVLALFVGTQAFPTFLILSLLVGFFRINLGVHFLNDVLAGFVIGFLSYDVVDRFFSKGTLTLHTNSQNRKFEFRRQLLHVFIGVLLLFALFLFTTYYRMNGPVYLEFLIFIGLVFLLVLINYRMCGGKNPQISFIFDIFERAGSTQGYGAFWYGMGILFAFVFISNISFLAATIVALGIGDGIATLVGTHGRIRNPINPNKTIEGTLAFFASTAIFSYFLLGPFALLFAAVTAFVESLPPKLDDNFTIPLASVLLYALVF